MVAKHCLPTSEPIKTLQPGTLIGERFELARPLGGGSMGRVWVARQKGLRREVALKFIHDALSSHQEILARFEREAAIISQIESSHVVKVHDYGIDPGTALPYLAMELLSGESLAERLERKGPLSLHELVPLVSQICRGLSRAHKLGIVHRDIKPDNLFLCRGEDDEEELVKLLDFGIAKDSANLLQDGSQTYTGMLLGTPLYMSPEQAQGLRTIDHRTDLYSLAGVAYHCLTGHPPFEKDTVALLMIAIVSHPAPSLADRGVKVPGAIERWLARGLAKDAASRFQSAREMAEELRSASVLPDQSPPPAWSDVSGQYSKLNLLSKVDPSSEAQKATLGPATFPAETAATKASAGEAPPDRPTRGTPTSARRLAASANKASSVTESHEEIEFFVRDHISADNLPALLAAPAPAPAQPPDAAAPAPAGGAGLATAQATPTPGPPRAPVALVLVGLLLAVSSGLWFLLR